METAKSTGLSCGSPIFCLYGPLHVYHPEIDTEIFVFYDEMTWNLHKIYHVDKNILNLL